MLDNLWLDLVNVYYHDTFLDQNIQDIPTQTLSENAGAYALY